MKQRRPPEKPFWLRPSCFSDGLHPCAAYAGCAVPRRRTRSLPHNASARFLEKPKPRAWLAPHTLPKGRGRLKNP
ncbi:tetraacyldisaccharide 4'-kinase [Neisseria bacilliformis ATCC BAA-1200]|uniref:Tetraacyldisaccharide 4'-kinase n=1 Tax=Neisseria bacilliformis ATCC BAA-1200 TaxID=888742 RepID=F2BAU6_9NEIS|nr:tetraacyldisaccharide 4'-kinase [Neisseria bacilliformis ATCC BAA-1200]